MKGPASLQAIDLLVAGTGIGRDRHSLRVAIWRFAGHGPLPFLLREIDNAITWDAKPSAIPLPSLPPHSRRSW